MYENPYFYVTKYVNIQSINDIVFNVLKGYSMQTV